MISVIITSFNEAATIGRSLAAFLSQLPPEAEILVVSPDAETIAVINAIAENHPQVHQIQDQQQGKPAALNIGLEHAQGEIVILSDGDVFIGDHALNSLLEPFKESDVGAVTGRPVSVNSKTTILGYWSHLLTDSVHTIRQKRDSAREFLLCSGYFFAFRRQLIDTVPLDALAEDAVISHVIAEQGYRIRYVSDAEVFVKYPTTYKDWLWQKVRSTGGYVQDYVRQSRVQMRSLPLEITTGAFLALSYPKTLQEFVWTLLLFLARLHLWLLVFINVKLRSLPLSQIWKRVETTKHL